jgi:hypothetical protein
MTRPAAPVPDGGELRLAGLALAAALLPVIVVHACYALSVAAGHVPGCVPYLDGCTSISAAGRHGTAYFLFKAGMIPAAVLLAAYWVLARRWLLGLGGADAAAARAMVALGVASAAFLVLYAVYLGSTGDFYGLMRRYGVTVHLSFAVMAQILLTREVLQLPVAARARLPAWLPRAMLAVVGLSLALGLANVPLGVVLPDKDRAENAIEWNFALLMTGYYLLCWRAWRATGFRARLTVGAEG